MNDIVNGNTSEDSVIEAADNLITILQSGADKSAQSSAVFFIDNHIMTYVNKTTGQVSGVGSLQGGVGKTLTGTVGTDEVFQHAHTFLKVRKNGVLNGQRFGTCLLGLSHQTTHTRQLADLTGTTTGSRIKHHVHGIESLVGLFHCLHQNGRKVVVNVGPSVNNLVVTFLVCDETHSVFRSNTLDFLVTLTDEFFLFFGNDNIAQVE